MSGIAYGGHLFPIAIDPDALCKFGLQDQIYVTIHNGFDAEFQTAYGFADKSTKVYPHFAQVLSAVRARHHGLLVVQLGTTTSRTIEGVDVQLIGKTSLSETAGILAGAALHIDNESGLVHLAACLGTVSCVLFGPTPAAYFGYESNINISPIVCGGCWWTTANWMTHCPRRFEQPICLANTPPEAVANAISAFLDQQRKQVRAEGTL
jgi:ADP-heptose:LPS heptosyltransferase